MRLETLFVTRSFSDLAHLAPPGAWIDGRPPSKQHPDKGWLFVVSKIKEKKK